MKLHKYIFSVLFQENSAILVGLFLIWLSGACAVKQPVITKPEVQEEQLRGFNIPAGWWINRPPDSLRVHMDKILNALSGADYHIVFFEFPLEKMELLSGEPDIRSGDNYRGLVEYVIREAHILDLKFYVSLKFPAPDELKDLPDDTSRPADPRDGNSMNGKNQPPPTHKDLAEMKSGMKTRVHSLALQYDIDGILYDLTGFPLNILGNDPSLSPGETYDPAGDLLEDLVVESMLLKPYLVNLCAFPGTSAERPVAWLNKGFLDGLIPVFNAEDFRDQVSWSGQVSEAFSGNVFPGFRFVREEQVTEYTIAENLKGLVFFPDPVWLSMNYNRLSQLSFPAQKKLPYPLKNNTANQVFSLDLSLVITGDKAGRTVDILSFERKKVTDMEGRIGFTGKMAMDTLYLVVDGYEVKLDTRFWQVPYKYAVLKEGGVVRESPWIELRRAPDHVIHEPEFHLLYKTAWPAKAWINGDTVKVYETGIFFNRIRFTEGLNRIEAGVLSADSSFRTYTQEFNYVKKSDFREPFPLWIDESSITPQMDLVLLPDDQVNISFRGSRGQNGQVIFHPDHRTVICNRTDFGDYSLYEAEIPLNDWETGRKYTFSLMLMPTEQENTPGLEIFTQASITTRRLEEFPWIRIGQDNTRLTYNLGAVRLGGPLKAEYSRGVVIKTNGIAGDHYRVTLNQVEQGLVQMENVEELPFSYTRSPYFITSLACGPADSADILSIPYPYPVPYAVIPEPELKRIRIRLYGVKTSSTWISHRQGCRLIDRIGWEQVTPETYEVHVYLKTSAIWGYDLAREGNALTFRVKYPPEFDPMAFNPLAGLKIAIEAGHGGESYGAMGLSGLLEKDINLDLSRKFGDLCRSRGAEVIQVRENDTTISLLDKRNMARDSGADLLISVHANAAGTSRGYLGVAGTSTYYHNPFWARLAEIMYDNLLELDLGEFGVVGSFNYTVVRNSEMPSILVEQAFMTHAEDEEKLARPAFRQAMAEKMYAGIIEYLQHMKMEEQ